uniref:Uncharacterized protein n=1 Tax=Cannabis sativa TaxID=3483 RepID=A0A803PBY9_CANSA
MGCLLQMKWLPSTWPSFSTCDKLIWSHDNLSLYSIKKGYWFTIGELGLGKASSSIGFSGLKFLRRLSKILGQSIVDRYRKAWRQSALASPSLTDRCWVPPPVDFAKVNVDAALDIDGGFCGMAW